MSAFLLALLLLRITVGESQPTPPTSLVPEDRPDYSFRAGVLELRGRYGWLRTERLLLNFRVAFEFKATTPDADPGVFVRTWVSPGQLSWSVWGYRIRLPTSITTEPSAVLVGRQRRVMVVQKGQVVLQPPSEWQSVEITGEGSQVSITLNGTRVGVFEVEEFGGYVLFNNEKGVVQFRDVRIASTERKPEIPDGLITYEQLKKATGKTPKVVREVKPRYTMDAMREKVQGVVAMQIVVMPDGSTGSVRVARSLHRDLDLSAIAAVRAWKFESATLNDQKVPVLADVEMSFTLK